MKICAKCGEAKPLKKFGKEVKKPDGLAAYCTSCTRATSANYYRTVSGRLSARLGEARKRTKDSDVTLSFLKELYAQQKGLCHYTRAPLSIEVVDGHYNLSGLSIDRVDSSRGYYQDNVVLCCWVVNAMKKDLSLEDFLDLCRSVVAYHE